MNSLTKLLKGPIHSGLIKPKPSYFKPLSSSNASPLLFNITKHSQQTQVKLDPFPSRNQAKAPGPTQEESAELNQTKSSMKHTYYEETPLSYIQWLSPLDYGKFQDVFIDFASSMVEPLLLEKMRENKPLKVVDLGCLYGNSSLALMDKLSWNETIAFWLDNQSQIKNKKLFKVIGVDLSEEALRYGQERGIYDETFVQNFNEPFNEKLKQHIESADVMICLMATNYMLPNVWQKIVNDIFLTDRSARNKVLFYNQVCLFQKEDISPEILLSDQEEWESDKIFTKHRLLTPKESAANHNNKESWTYLYGVKCDKL